MELRRVLFRSCQSESEMYVFFFSYKAGVSGIYCEIHNLYTETLTLECHNYTVIFLSHALDNNL